MPEHPVLQIVHGPGETGAALCRVGRRQGRVHRLARHRQKVMAACAETLTPVLIEGGGKDAMIVDDDADLDAAAEARAPGAPTQRRPDLRRHRAGLRARAGLRRVRRQAGRARPRSSTVGEQIGPITMPGQIDIIRRHIDDALARGGRAVLGGPDAVQPPFVKPTILVDVPEDSAAVREETFGPTLTITKVATRRRGDHAGQRHRLRAGPAVFAKRARAWRSPGGCAPA